MNCIADGEKGTDTGRKAFSLRFNSPLWRSVKIQRTPRFIDRPYRDAVGINHGRLQACVAQFGLDGADIIISLQQVCDIGMAEGMGL